MDDFLTEGKPAEPIKCCGISPQMYFMKDMYGYIRRIIECPTCGKKAKSSLSWEMAVWEWNKAPK